MHDFISILPLVIINTFGINFCFPFRSNCHGEGHVDNLRQCGLISWGFDLKN